MVSVQVTVLAPITLRHLTRRSGVNRNPIATGLLVGHMKDSGREMHSTNLELGVAKHKSMSIKNCNSVVKELGAEGWPGHV